MTIRPSFSHELYCFVMIVTHLLSFPNPLLVVLSGIEDIVCSCGDRGHKRRASPQCLPMTSMTKASLM